MHTLTRYGFSNVICGFFAFPTAHARRILPSDLEPIELHHDSAVFSMTVFDFTHSEIGAYREVVMAVIVAPLLKRGEPMPKAAFYPYLVATNTRAARDHAIQRWHLPHWKSDVDIQFHAQQGQLSALVTADDAPVAELAVTDHSWEPVAHRYQSFMRDDARLYQARVTMQGELCEHEEETGRLRLHRHPFNRSLSIEDIDERPFREQWMRDGLQTFEPLETLREA